MKQIILIIIATIFLISSSLILNFRQFKEVQNADINLSALVTSANANDEWIECTNCKYEYYYCTAQSKWMYMCKPGGTSCNVSGQEVCD